MRLAMLNTLVDPYSGATLELLVEAARGDDVLEGSLIGDSGRFQIVRGIPRFVRTEDAGQSQTQESFGFKWTNREGFGSPGMQRQVSSWVLERYGFATAKDMQEAFGARERILDAGCGAGLATSTWLAQGWRQADNEFVGVDISTAIDVARERLGAIEGTSFVQADLLNLPLKPASFDLVFSEGVLHHTPSSETAFKALARLLRPRGEIMIYVYRRKAPAREFVDDYVRERIASLAPAAAWDALRPLTRLGKALAELDVQVEVPEDVELLGIPRGTYDVQRLVYWHFAKMFWNPAMTFEENNHVNFDWYHPRYAHRHTEEEVRKWFADCDLEITRFEEQEAGFTVRGTLID
jgi:SAM-dependent methyltransferase